MPMVGAGSVHYGTANEEESLALGRGFLTGTLTRRTDLGEGDYRLVDPRFSEENFGTNLAIVDVLKAVAQAHGASAAQVGLAWLLAQGEDIAPIPGSKRRATMKDSMAAAELELTHAELATLDAAAPRGRTSGPRYGASMMSMVDR